VYPRKITLVDKSLAARLSIACSIKVHAAYAAAKIVFFSLNLIVVTTLGIS